MIAEKKNVAIVGVAARAACCAGPILAVLAAIGLIRRNPCRSN